MPSGFFVPIPPFRRGDRAAAVNAPKRDDGGYPHGKQVITLMLGIASMHTLTFTAITGLGFERDLERVCRSRT